ncbi:putative sugar transporter [Hyaloscypha hepaticicola]|uniref:Putative sugar transporter n=1 Tax=Hyaloscypha hepaticicola TaxID=2082293 RepID=A0A2J6PT55_9HELO|nr:putative sugar transporter [Hyaloscypha hepaticicola]
MATTTEYNLEKIAGHHVEETLGHGALIDAKHASDEEHAQTLWQAIKANKKAVGWSVLVSMSVVMEGYDTILIGNFFGYPEFQKKYGHDYGGTAGYQVSAPWQTGLGMASTVGAIFGGIMNGQLCAKYGYRWVMIIALGFMAAFIFIIFFAQSLPVLLVGEILCGFSWGVFATVGPAYASEVCPTNLRGYLTTFVNLCWAIGQFIAAGVLEGLINRPDQWSYRIPFALQWIWPVPLMIGCFYMPESPWYLVRNDRLEQAKHSIKRLSNDKTEEQLAGQLAMLVHTAKIEAEIVSGVSYLDCFTGIDLRRTEIACITFAGQILSGSTFAYSPTYFFEQAGMSSTQAYKMNVGSTAMAFTGTVLSWWLITYCGRRTLYVWGQGTLFFLQMIIGILSATTSSKGSLWGQAALCIIWVLTYSMTVGPIAYAIVAETSSVRLRALSVCLARTTYQIINIVSQVLEPYFMNPTAWNAKGKTAFFWGATALGMFVWSYFRLPEAKGRTYEEMDLLFQKKVSARKFSSTHVDPYAIEITQSKEALAPAQEEIKETK